MHANLASIRKHFVDLNLILSLLRFDLHIIAISKAREKIGDFIILKSSQRWRGERLFIFIFMVT